MDVMLRIERALEGVITSCEAEPSPPGLAAAMRYAVFPGGHRIRPKIAMAVALACGDDRPALADAGAASIELLHCASLVHDDLPAFDNASTRRGKPSVHRKFGEPLAVLVGDALIILAFEVLAKAAASDPDRLAPLIGTVGRAVGTPHGICAGQAWEEESSIDLCAYQRAKTGSLFAGATAVGAVAAGHHPAAWRALGERLGEAYQVADDICDLAADPEMIGKPIGQDAANARPNAAAEFGIDGAKRRLKELITTAVDEIPSCPGRDMLSKVILKESSGFLPKDLALEPA